MSTLPAALRPLADDPDRAGVVVDFDGTLAMIVDRPEDAVALPEARDALGTLVGAIGVVGVISGRPVEFLREHVGLDGVVLVGQYGMERLDDDAVRHDPRAQPFLSAVAAAADEAASRWPQLLIERKGALAVAVHWRTTPEDAPDPDELHALATRHGLALLAGRMVCELRPDLPIDKGDALTALLDEHAVRHAAFIGDDTGDLPAFAALDALVADGRLDGAARVAARSEESPPELLARADTVVDGPRGVAALLTTLAAALPRP